MYAHRRQAQQHERALEALRRVVVGDELWGIPVFVVGEFVRLVTHPSLFEYPTSLADALASVTGLVGAGGERILRPGWRYWTIFQEVVADARATANRVFDAQIAAVCLEHGATTVLTEDRGFRRFSGIAVQTLE